MAELPTSAGIIPFSVTPTGCIYFLLGQERKIEGYKFGSLKWSEFAGGKKGQESVVETAAREFLEETLDCVPFDQLDMSVDVGYRIRYESIVDQLKREQYTFKITYVADIGPEWKPAKKVRTCYIRQIPWNPTCVDAFAATRHHLSEIQSKTSPLHKDELVNYPEKIARHQAIRVVDDGRLRVSKDFLEKQKIAYFSIPDLREMIAARGSQSRHTLLRTFVPLLEKVLDYFPTFPHLPLYRPVLPPEYTVVHPPPGFETRVEKQPHLFDD